LWRVRSRKKTCFREFRKSPTALQSSFILKRQHYTLKSCKCEKELLFNHLMHTACCDSVSDPLFWSVLDWAFVAFICIFFSLYQQRQQIRHTCSDCWWWVRATVYLGDQERHAQHLLTKSSHAPSAALPFQHIEYSSHTRTHTHPYINIMHWCMHAFH